jgi:LasA protease
VIRAVSASIVLMAFLSSCSPPPDLWGTYNTPTAVPALPHLASTPAIQVVKTQASAVPTAAVTHTPTASPPPTATAELATEDTQGAVPTEGIYTPTFDVPAILYYAQSGDTLEAVAHRFEVEPSEVRSEASLPETGLVAPGTLLVIPDRIVQSTTPSDQIIPDSELVFSGTAADFDIAGYIGQAGGRLAGYREYLGSTGWTTGPDEIRRLAYENSINPRLLLAILEYESRWVDSESVDLIHDEYPMGYVNLYYRGLFSQMVWAVNQLSIGYYGWRTGTITELQFPDGSRLRLNPRLNAGTVALQYLFSKLHDPSQWSQMINPGNGFLAMYMQMFGDPWARGDLVDPIFPSSISQPVLSLPFEPDIQWSLTGGPHGAWEHDGSLAAIDFAPATDHGGCDPTPTWITAAAPGLIVRSERGVVVEDLDGDGYEQTGWDLIYLHVATTGRVAAGTYVKANDRIGHASCEGGQATGTHLHFARKYNGEWVAADGPLPFQLDGWTVHQGQAPYEGTLTRGDKTVVADPVGQFKSVIIRSPNDP